MSESTFRGALPKAPNDLAFGEVRLRFERFVPGDPRKGFVPAYHFRICLGDGSDVGHINLRVGETEHVRLFAGHIGYEVREPFRGHGYALQACRALAPFVRTFSARVIITCDPDNFSSRRTIEKLGASFIDEVPVSPQNPHYQTGSRSKRRYQWEP